VSKQNPLIILLEFVFFNKKATLTRYKKQETTKKLQKGCIALFSQHNIRGKIMNYKESLKAIKLIQE
jgi:hypothetical protein